MALFCRSNVHTLFSLNNVYYKFMLDNVKRRLSKCKRTRMEDHSIERKPFKQSPFYNSLNDRRDEASRSILVQVQSYKSYTDLYSYCSEFGNINAMSYYCANNNHYILVEFRDSKCIKNIISASTFLSDKLVVPVKTPSFWFRHISKKPTSKNNNLYDPEKYYINKSIDKQVEAAAHLKGSISEQILFLYKSIKLNSVETKLRFYIASQLERCISGVFPDGGVYPFGSSVNGFGKKGCDLDLVLLPNLDHMVNGNQSRLIFHTKSLGVSVNKHLIKHILDGLAVMMNNFVPGIESITRILHARVPIVKFHHSYTSIDCDLSANNLNAIQMSELLWLYGAMDCRVRPLTLFLKIWAHNRALIKSSPCPSITNFSLTLLIVYFLQHKKILPSMEAIKNGKIDTTAVTQEANISDSLEFLLLDFYQFYSEFNFRENMICIRKGTSVSVLRQNNPLYIRNPFEMDLNVSTNVTAVEVLRLQAQMKAAVELFANCKKQNIVQRLLDIRHVSVTNSRTTSYKETSKLEESNIPINDISQPTTSNFVSTNSDAESTEAEQNTVTQS